VKSGKVANWQTDPSDTTERNVLQPIKSEALNHCSHCHPGQQEGHLQVSRQLLIELRETMKESWP
jgi:hypothetical protein